MQCSNCNNDLDDALILVCDHNLCLPCAAKLSSGSTTIRCRVCASATTLEQSSAQQLREMFPQFSAPSSSAASPMVRPISLFSRPPLSHTPVNVQSPVMSARSGGVQLPVASSLSMPNMGTPPANFSSSYSSTTNCGQCEMAQADLRCMQCEEVLCFDCSESLHRRGKLSTHQVVPLSYGNGGQTPMSTTSPMSRSQMGDRSIITMKAVTCSQHPDEIVQYFCLKCECRPMCSECVFRSGEHTTHLQDVVLIKKAFPKVRSRINDLVVEFERSIKDIRINEVNLSENKKSMENVSMNCRGQINKLFNEVREMLRVREMDLMRQIEVVVEKEVKQVEKELERNAEKRGKIENVSRLLNSVRDIPSSAASYNPQGFEKEIEILDAFSEMKSSVLESRAEMLKNDLNLVQLFIATDQVARTNRQVDYVKAAIGEIAGIVPSRNAPLSTDSLRDLPQPTSSSGASREGSVSGGVRRKKSSSSGAASKTATPATQSDTFLMSAIEDALRAT